MKFVMGDGHKNHFVVLLCPFAPDYGFNIVRGPDKLANCRITTFLGNFKWIIKAIEISCKYPTPAFEGGELN